MDVKNAPVGSEVYLQSRPRVPVSHLRSEVVGLFIGTGAVVPNDDLSIPPTRITRSTSQVSNLALRRYHSMALTLMLLCSGSTPSLLLA